MQIPVHNRTGGSVENIELRDDVFSVPFNEALVHQAVVRQMANRRQGTVSTKTRSEVSGSNRKMYRQKGTGRARHGTKKAPIFRGGGVTFGPKPRSFTQRMPKKMRRAAIRCALSAKAGGGQLVVVDELAPDEPKTNAMREVLQALGVERSALLVTQEANGDLVRAASNLGRVKTMPAMLLNVVDVLSHNSLVMTVDAVRQVENWLGSRQRRPETA
jgi:large subunit ribosomal protein L4